MAPAISPLPPNPVCCSSRGGDGAVIFVPLVVATARSHIFCNVNLPSPAPPPSIYIYPSYRTFAGVST